MMVVYWACGEGIVWVFVGGWSMGSCSFAHFWRCGCLCLETMFKKWHNVLIALRL